MRMKSNLKKVLSIVLAASVVTTTSALAGLAAGEANGTTTEKFSLLPTSVDQVTRSRMARKEMLPSRWMKTAS